jgi:hypothetical protein
MTEQEAETIEQRLMTSPSPSCDTKRVNGNHRAIETSLSEITVKFEPIESTGHGWTESLVSLREWGKFHGSLLPTVAECYNSLPTARVRRETFDRANGLLTNEVGISEMALSLIWLMNAE